MLQRVESMCMDVNRRETCKAHMYVEYILTYDVIAFNEKCKGKGTIIYNHIYIYTVHCMKVQFSILITDNTSTVIVMLVCNNRQLSIIMVSESCHCQ